jgi:hypothetical protein
MSDQLTPRQIEDVSKATTLAEHGNATRLRDMVHDLKDIGEHNKIISAMMNLNQQHIHAFELMEKQGLKPSPVSPLKFDEVPKTENGELIITRSLSSNGRSIYREIYNSTKKEFVDSGSVTRPSGFIPEFVPHNE